MIISASRRTDIPAFYSQWFMNRVRAGFCEIVNPFNSNQKTVLSLKPGDLDAIVFWTRYPAPLLPHLPELDRLGFSYYFQFTITPYQRDLEFRTINLEKSIASFMSLSSAIGKERVIWRYDPILIGSNHSFHYHRENFNSLANVLAPHTRRVLVSFADFYKKTERNLKTVAEKFVPNPEKEDGFRSFVEQLAGIAKAHQLEIQSCAEERDLVAMGIPRGACIDQELIARLTGKKLDLPKDPHQRKACRCVVSKDIGAYNTCLFGCRYCYAVNNHKAARKMRVKIGKQSTHLS